MCPFKRDKPMKRPTGIPQTFLININDPSMPGVYKTNTGYAVPAIDAVAYAQGKKERPPFLPNETRKEQEPAKAVPKDYLCPLCSNIMTDAVLIPSCGNSYCDECIRNDLLDTEEHICPTCGESEISPDSLIPNRFLRTSISSFYNETGTMVITTGVKAKPVIHAQHNGPGPQQPGVAPQAQSGSPVTQKPYMPSSRPTGALFGANALPRLQMSRPSSQGPAPLQQLTTRIQNKVSSPVPQTTVTDEELAKGMTIKTTLGYRRSMRFSSQDLPKPRRLPPRPSMRPPMILNINMPPPWSMHAQAFLGSPPAEMYRPHVLLPPPPGPIPTFTSVETKEKSPLSRSRARSRSGSPRRSRLNFHSITTTARSSPPSTTDDKIESKHEPLPVPEMDQLELDSDEISRREKEERFTDSSPYFKSKVALEKKALPRSVMESAGKVLSQKPMQLTLASAMSSPSIKPQPAKTRHHVFLDREDTPEEIQDRKLTRKSRKQSIGPSEQSLTLSSLATPVQQEERKPKKTHRALPMNESIMDESEFEPDYDEWTSDSEEGKTDRDS
ncbi:hypothetical protein CHS0354_040564 [Potamilus streckersoni]|uniref:RING-type domain-containing protein n=1 Tax=Potamilus streckersoni TaxID=2493646 RepID=A0AAE0SH79_9BIVA|nr:hypothetical protein CHS0354_040564 [Potamilus streckersoni]